jgi:hypothetical protein
MLEIYLNNHISPFEIELHFRQEEIADLSSSSYFQTSWAKTLINETYFSQAHWNDNSNNGKLFEEIGLWTDGSKTVIYDDDEIYKDRLLLYIAEKIHSAIVPFLYTIFNINLSINPWLIVMTLLPTNQTTPSVFRTDILKKYKELGAYSIQALTNSAFVENPYWNSIVNVVKNNNANLVESEIIKLQFATMNKPFVFYFVLNNHESCA